MLQRDHQSAETRATRAGATMRMSAATLLAMSLLVAGFSCKPSEDGDKAIPEKPPQLKPDLNLAFDETGAALLAELARKNAPSGDGGKSPTFKRHLAMILEGLVVSSPTINAEISSRLEITNFSSDELRSVGNILDDRVLKGPRLHPDPIEERTSNNAKIPGAGGTVLVYRMIPKRHGFPDLDSLKQLIDPKGLYQITVRATGNDRIEIILPRKGKQAVGKDLTSKDINRIKRLVSRAGLLEFRILANSEDDKAAIENAMTLMNSGTPEVNKALEQTQLEGLPPLVPRTQGLAGDPKVYALVLTKGAKSRVTYSWVELGPPELRHLKLDTASRADPKRTETWKEAAKFRGKATTLATPGGTGQKLLQGALFYSRECKDRNLPKEERAEKHFEYFVLARNPEINPVTGKETARIDGSYLQSIGMWSGLIPRPPR
jgi:hypothetical protein